MKRLSTLVFASLFAASTGAWAAGHMKGEKDAKMEKTAKASSKSDDAKKAKGEPGKKSKGEEGKKAK